MKINSPSCTYGLWGNISFKSPCNWLGNCSGIEKSLFQVVLYRCYHLLLTHYFADQKHFAYDFHDKFKFDRGNVPCNSITGNHAVIFFIFCRDEIVIERKVLLWVDLSGPTNYIDIRIPFHCQVFTWIYSFSLIQMTTMWSLQNFAHVTTAVLSWHVQKLQQFDRQTQS